MRGTAVRSCTALCLAGALAACGDGGPTEPETQVARVEVTPGMIELQLGDTIHLTATAYDGDGSVVTAQPVIWTSSNTAVLDVDASGLATGRGGGSATIRAAIGGRTGEATGSVEPWNIAAEAVVIDSTEMRLVSDSSEQAAGTYRFELTGTQAAPSPGDVIVGAQGLGFLRRVMSATASGSVVTLQTEDAALSDIIREGSFQSNVPLTLTGATFAPGPATARVTLLHAMEVLYAAPGVNVREGGLDLQNLDFCELVSCPDDITEFRVASGSVNFAPELDFGATWTDADLQEFHGIANGALTLDIDVVLEAQQQASFSREHKIAEISRVFLAFIGAVPVVMQAKFELTASFSADATLKGRMQAGFTNAHTVEVGARWSEGGGWEGVLETERSFDAREPSFGDSTLSGQLTLESKVSLKPKLSVLLYGVAGPFVDVEPYGKATLTFGSESCGIKSVAGIDTSLGFEISVVDPDVGTFTETFSPFTWPGLDWQCPLGHVNVSVSTSGAEPDGDGYTLLVDGRDEGTIAVSGSRTLEWIPVGTHQLQLSGVANNCTLEGSNPVEITLSAGHVENVAFSVTCSATTGSLTAHASTTGSNQDLDGYTVVVDGTQRLAVDGNGTVSFEGLAAGDHQVGLEDVSANCTVAGDNPRTITIAAGTTVETAFDVSCAATELRVFTSTSGTPIESVDYTVTVDETMSQTIAPNGSATFAVPQGTHTVALSGLAANCEVDGENPRTVEVPADGAGEATFAVTCTSGELTVIVSTEGDPGVANYTVTVDGNDSQTVTATGGTVVFNELPGGNHWVEITGVAEECVILDANPRNVVVPGSTTFEIDCTLGLADIVFSNGGLELWTMRDDATNLQKIYSSPSGSPLWPSWSVDGEKIVFHRRANGIWMINADGSGLTQLSVPDVADSDPDWSPDGTRVVFYRDEGDTIIADKSYHSVTNLHVVNTAGGAPVPITNGIADDILPATDLDKGTSWSPDGTTIAFAAYTGIDSTSAGSDIYTVSADGGSATRRTHLGDDWETSSPAWSPDGTRIAFIAAPIQSGDAQIRTMNPDGSGMTTVFSFGGFLSGMRVAWGPDGTTLTLSAAITESSTHVWTLNADGSGLVMLAEGRTADRSW